jgi:hypothetical protein
VTFPSDDADEMPRHPALDDAAIEALIADPTGDPLLGGFLEDLRMAARGPDPVPSTELAAMLAGGLLPDDHVPATSTWSAPVRTRRLRVPRIVAGLSLAAKVLLGAGVAAAATTGAGAAGVLPRPVQGAVAGVVGATTPFTFPDHASERSDFGGGVSTDARDETPGVDGSRIADRARDAERLPGPQATPPVDAPPPVGLSPKQGPSGGAPPVSVPPPSVPPVSGPPLSVPPVSTPQAGAGSADR